MITASPADQHGVSSSPHVRHRSSEPALPQHRLTHVDTAALRVSDTRGLSTGNALSLIR